MCDILYIHQYMDRELIYVVHKLSWKLS